MKFFFFTAVFLLLSVQQSFSKDSITDIKDGIMPFFLEFDNNIEENKLTTKQKRRLVFYSGAAAYAGSLTGLYFLWYKDYPQTSFHFYDDNKSWKQMDKLGHATASYYMGILGHKTLLWAEIDERKALWYGGFAGSLYLSVIEILDGFSAEWGFSWGDFAANLAGSALYVSQKALWDDNYFNLKYSFWPSQYAEYRPDIFGDNIPQNFLKDYNAISFWLSVSPQLFLRGNNNLPPWLDLSIGYSADGILGAYSNPSTLNGKPLPEFERHRQFFLSLDINLKKIPIENKYFNAIAHLFSFLKIPMPAFEFHSGNGLRFHPIYF